MINESLGINERNVSRGLMKLTWLCPTMLQDSDESSLCTCSTDAALNRGGSSVRCCVVYTMAVFCRVYARREGLLVKIRMPIKRIFFQNVQVRSVSSVVYLFLCFSMPADERSWSRIWQSPPQAAPPAVAAAITRRGEVTAGR